MEFSERVRAFFTRLTRRHYLLGGAGLILLVIVASALVGASGNGNGEALTVLRRNVVEEVTVSGRVEAGVVADLGFEVAGRVATVSAREGDTVPAGALLVSLDLSTLRADLATAQADVLIKEAELENAAVNLADTTEQQDTLVASARATLLSDDLEAVSSSASVTAASPTLSGRYDGPEGAYKVRVVLRDGSLSRYDLYTFGLESTGPTRVSETSATPLGTHGLFISFPDTLGDYRNTTWYVTIPNTDGASYTANQNAYEEAIRTRSLAIQQAEADIAARGSGVAILSAELARARASVAKIQAQIAQRRLTAPFLGIVTQVEVDPGEIVSANTVAVSLISGDGFGVEIELPEIDSVRVRAGNPARVTIDAIGKEVRFNALVTSVNRTETIVDGVPVYEARLMFTEEDERVRSGMTADVTITTDERSDVLAVPARAISYREDGTPYVRVGSRKVHREVDVVMGLRGSDGYVEIVAGLEAGDTVYVSAR